MNAIWSETQKSTKEYSVHIHILSEVLSYPIAVNTKSIIKYTLKAAMYFSFRVTIYSCFRIFHTL